MTKKNIELRKILSANDTGDTGAHQAGMLIPKRNPVLLSYFPALDSSEKNPRALLRFKDEWGGAWQFNFIYYNNRKFGGTRNEFRLTGMTKYLRSEALAAGDCIILGFDQEGFRTISFERAKPVQADVSGVLRLGNEWRVISY